jgi:hypothetical protein
LFAINDLPCPKALEFPDRQLFTWLQRLWLKY